MGAVKRADLPGVALYTLGHDVGILLAEGRLLQRGALLRCVAAGSVKLLLQRLQMRFLRTDRTQGVAAGAAARVVHRAHERLELLVCLLQLLPENLPLLLRVVQTLQPLLGLGDLFFQLRQRPARAASALAQPCAQLCVCLGE